MYCIIYLCHPYILSTTVLSDTCMYIELYCTFMYIRICNIILCMHDHDALSAYAVMSIAIRC